MTATEPSTGLVVGTFFLGLLASVCWPLTQHVITMAHEGSHALFGSVTGGRVTSVTMRADGTGLTVAEKPNRFVFTITGYVGPSLFGVLGATLLANGVPPDAILWVSLALLVVVFFQIRNLFGWLAVIVSGVTLFMIARYATPGGRAVFAYTLVWFLLLGGFVHTALYNRKSVGWSGDASLLREMTKLPRGFWGLLWWLATLAALVYGGGLVVGAVEPIGHAGR